MKEKKNFKHHANVLSFILTHVSMQNQDAAVVKVGGIKLIIFLGEVRESDYR